MKPSDPIPARLTRLRDSRSAVAPPGFADAVLHRIGSQPVRASSALAVTFVAATTAAAAAFTLTFILLQRAPSAPPSFSSLHPPSLAETLVGPR